MPMSSLCRSVVGLGLLAAALVPAAALTTPADATRRGPGTPDPIREAKALADKIDQVVATQWRADGVKPAAPADDDEFLRRVYLDVMGRIPRVSEVLDFKDREIPLPRENWINKELLESSDYATHFAVTWRNLIVPPDNGQIGPQFANTIELLLRQ